MLDLLSTSRMQCLLALPSFDAGVDLSSNKVIVAGSPANEERHGNRHHGLDEERDEEGRREGVPVQSDPSPLRHRLNGYLAVQASIRLRTACQHASQNCRQGKG